MVKTLDCMLICSFEDQLDLAGGLETYRRSPSACALRQISIGSLILIVIVMPLIVIVDSMFAAKTPSPLQAGTTVSKQLRRTWSICIEMLREYTHGFFPKLFISSTMQVLRLRLKNTDGTRCQKGRLVREKAIQRFFSSLAEAAATVA